MRAHSVNKYTPEQYKEVIRLHERGHIFARIAERTGVNRATIRAWVVHGRQPISVWTPEKWEEWRIHSFTETHKKNLSLSKLGSKNPNWKGDNIKPSAGWARARKILGKIKGLETHHIDGNPLNNDPSNLVHITRKQHMIEDGRLERFRESCPYRKKESNLPLMSAEKAEKWTKPQPPKKACRTFNDPEDVVRCRR